MTRIEIPFEANKVSAEKKTAVVKPNMPVLDLNIVCKSCDEKKPRSEFSKSQVMKFKKHPDNKPICLKCAEFLTVKSASKTKPQKVETAEVVLEKLPRVGECKTPGSMTFPLDTTDNNIKGLIGSTFTIWRNNQLFGHGQGCKLQVGGKTVTFYRFPRHVFYAEELNPDLFCRTHYYSVSNSALSGEVELPISLIEKAVQSKEYDCLIIPSSSLPALQGVSFAPQSEVKREDVKTAFALVKRQTPKGVEFRASPHSHGEMIPFDNCNMTINNDTENGDSGMPVFSSTYITIGFHGGRLNSNNFIICNTRAFLEWCGKAAAGLFPAGWSD